MEKREGGVIARAAHPRESEADDYIYCVTIRSLLYFSIYTFYIYTTVFITIKYAGFCFALIHGRNKAESETREQFNCDNSKRVFYRQNQTDILKFKRDAFMFDPCKRLILVFI